MVEQVSATCHGLEVIATRHATSKGWSGIVGNMIQRGATARPQEIHTIVDYLAIHFAKPALLNINKAAAKEIETALDLTGREASAIREVPWQDHGDFKDWDGLVNWPTSILKTGSQERPDRLSQTRTRPASYLRTHPYRVWPGSAPAAAYCSLNFDMLSAVYPGNSMMVLSSFPMRSSKFFGTGL